MLDLFKFFDGLGNQDTKKLLEKRFALLKDLQSGDGDGDEDLL